MNFSRTISKQKNQLFDLLIYMSNADSAKMFPLDYLAWACANRSLNIAKSIHVLIKNKQGIGAVSLARIHLDTLLRLWAAWLVDNPHDFAMKVLNGDKIDNLKDKNGNFLRDSYLRDTFSKENNADWVVRVYNETSGFVHLSSKSIFQSIKSFEEGERKISFSISDESVLTQSDKHEIEAFVCRVNDEIIRLITSWALTKDGKLPTKSTIKS